MVEQTPTDASVMLWGRQVAAVSWIGAEGYAAFQYDPQFVASGIQLSPLAMPLGPDPHSFPALPRRTFKGLPGLLADALPDRYGNKLIDAWLAERGESPDSFNPVERLCFVGPRGMGALEFKPVIDEFKRQPSGVEVAHLVRLANLVLEGKPRRANVLGSENDRAAIDDLLRTGTSAGGARAKAILAWNRDTDEFRHGHGDAEDGFEHWLMKFDGIGNNRDKEEPDPQGYGLIEYAYYLMATDAGIDMMPSRLHQEGGRSHFMTRRFDRPIDADGLTHKLHLQSLCALQHYDFNNPVGHSYEQAILTIRQLGLGAAARQQQFLRAIFNVIARNQDDHAKNIAFLMDQDGDWRLSPAFDVMYAYNPDGQWTGQHQMSLNGKRDDFTVEDLMAFARTASIKPAKARSLIEAVQDVVADWPRYASRAGIDPVTSAQLAKTHRIRIQA